MLGLPPPAQPPAQSFFALIESVQHEHNAIEGARAQCGAELQRVRTALAEETSRADHSRDSATELSLALKATPAPGAGPLLEQSARRAELAEVARLAQGVEALREANRGVSHQVLTVASASQDSMRRLWEKTSQQMLSVSAALASTRRRVDDLERDRAALQTTCGSLKNQLARERADVAVERVAAKRTELSQSRSALMQAESATLELQKRASGFAPRDDEYAKSLTAELSQLARRNQDLDDHIESLKRERQSMEGSISTMASG
mgnify:CR=1 FL=1